MPNQPADISLFHHSDGEFSFQAHSSAADAFLAETFSRFDDDLLKSEIDYIVGKARRLGFIVQHRNRA